MEFLIVVCIYPNLINYNSQNITVKNNKISEINKVKK